MIRHLKILPIIVLFVLLGCATQQKQESYVILAYKTLETAAIAYDATMDVLGYLYRDGRLSESHKDKAIEIGNQYRDAYNLAVDALASYKRVETVESQQKVETALEEVNRILRQLKDMLAKEGNHG